MIARERLLNTAREVYQSFGFVPIDTPALEYVEILAGKGSAETDHQMYRFQDAGGREVGLRFDLTVPLARYVAQHIEALGTPFKRYHMGTVWRGENPQKGRYREFMQCDFDTIGTTSPSADIETIAVVHELMLALGLTEFTISINHRGILNGLLQLHGLAEQSTMVLRAVDRLGKVDRDRVAGEIVEATSCESKAANDFLDAIQFSGDAEQVRTELESRFRDVGVDAGLSAAGALHEIAVGAVAAGVASSRLRIDLSIARGLDYYTGTVLETTLDAMPGIGSVCSGGRYDNLAGVYTKRDLPGIGASLGLDRMLAALEELQLLQPCATMAPVFIPYFDANRRDDYLAMACELRRAGIGVEVYPEPKKLGQQLKYAGEKGCRLAIIRGVSEFEAGTVQIKNLHDRSSKEIEVGDSYQALVEKLHLLI